MPKKTPGRERPEPHMCLIGLMDTPEHVRLMEIPESALPWAFKKGWSLVLRYRDDPTQPDSDPAATGEDDTYDGD